VFFLAALLPPVLRRFKKRGFPPRGMLVVCSLFFLLALAQTAGFIDCAGLLARWLLYQGL
jgi:predicted PurR-regulated permease PerM